MMMGAVRRSKLIVVNATRAELLSTQEPTSFQLKNMDTLSQMQRHKSTQAQHAEQS
jgi:hypothetical protein